MQIGIGADCRNRPGIRERGESSSALLPWNETSGYAALAKSGA
jgi:hypothetical protein